MIPNDRLYTSDGFNMPDSVAYQISQLFLSGQPTRVDTEPKDIMISPPVFWIVSDGQLMTFKKIVRSAPMVVGEKIAFHFFCSEEIDKAEWNFRRSTSEGEELADMLPWLEDFIPENPPSVNRRRILFPNEADSLEARFSERWEAVVRQSPDSVDTLLAMVVRREEPDAVRERDHWALKPLGDATRRDRIVAATLMQWLGTGVGSNWVINTMESKGYKVLWPGRSAQEETALMGKFRRLHTMLKRLVESIRRIDPTRNGSTIQEAEKMLTEMDPEKGEDTRTHL